jgi:hypothetical protein
VPVKRVYFPRNVNVTTTRSSAPFYTSNPSYAYIPGPINQNPFAGSNATRNINATIEINGLEGWNFDYAPNGVKNYIVRGTFSSVPGSAFLGFNAQNDYRYIWVESPNLTSIGANNFKNMNYIETIVVNVDSPPTLNSSGAFVNTNKTFKLYVPYSEDHSILDAYKAANVWSTKASQIYELNPDGTIPT